MYNVALDQSRDISGHYFKPAGFEHILWNNDYINLSLQYASMRNQMHNAHLYQLPVIFHAAAAAVTLIYNTKNTSTKTA